jgi:hypothetical protein
VDRHSRFAASLLFASLCALPCGSQAQPPLNLQSWKLTLPVDSELPGRPDEITQPRLASFVLPNLFEATADGRGLVFRAPCGGVPTRGSNYPRCELREMQADGSREAAWNTKDGYVHEMRMAAAITHLPKVKPHLVCAQIHDAKSDVLMIRLERRKLFVERKPSADVVLDAEYTLGKRFTLRIEARAGVVRLWHNDVLKLEWPADKPGCYFKAGCYTQSNPDRGDAADDYGHVIVYELTTRHQKID